MSQRKQGRVELHRKLHTQEFRAATFGELETRSHLEPFRPVKIAPQLLQIPFAAEIQW